MTYKDNQPTFNVNRKVVNYKDFLANIDAEKEELLKVKRNNPNTPDQQQHIGNGKYKYNKVTHKMDDLSPAEIEDNIDTIENYDQTNEGFGLALIAGVFGAIFAPSIYREAKNFWSKNIIGSKYKETGNVQKVICKFDKNNISPAVSSLTEIERQRGEVEIPLKEYKDIFGNIYYGYDHIVGSESKGEKEEFYTAMYRAEDLPILKEWLADGKRYEGKGRSIESFGIKPVDLIYIDDIRHVSSSGTPIGL